MGFKICMNSSCGTSRTPEWKKGWPLRSGGYADLCFRCGSAYESSIFCDTFHSEESGWRECYICSKRLHCGCIASGSLLQLLDYGGVGCASCAKSSGLHSIRKFGTHGDEITNGFGALSINNAGTCTVESRLSDNNPSGEDFVQLCSMLYAQQRNLLTKLESQRELQEEHNLLSQTVRSVRKEGGEIMHTNGEMGATFPNVTHPRLGPPLFTKTDSTRTLLDIRDMTNPLSQPSLCMTLGEPSGKPNFVLPCTNGVADGRDQSKTTPPFQQGQRSRPILPKLPKNGQALSSETNKGTAPQVRIARPPAEGRGKNHLLPRYWPRITDQELQQLSGDLKSTIVPLFEKVLSASDAGRIGRLVLPKACAEAYFPPISQSEGLPLRIQDVKGNEWTFQFRFWPNNNSRMYVLEGVTPCIQTMQLRAGDTVTFSRIDPGGKLVMGFRKATNSDPQDTDTSFPDNGMPSAVPSNSIFTETQPPASACSGLHQLPKGTKDPHIDCLSENISLPDGDISENYGSKGNGEYQQQQVVNSEKKRTRNIGTKNKRLLIHNEDALELRLTWEEAQDLLRPPPSVKPTVVTIEDHEFEEYDEPPVFGKRTIFTACSPGGQEQWAQCDDCSKWRRLPGNVLLPPKWTCADNVWDSSRCSCSADVEISPKELENLLRVRRDLKKRRLVEGRKLAQEHEPSGLDALACAAALGEKLVESGESSVGATTKHPRHRPGCSCIVCIQPPSGKGKHKATCTCNVCMTVKRRFKTLMLRKKRKQSEREAELTERESNANKDVVEINGARNGHSENEGSEGGTQAEVAEMSSGQIDLNCHPIREDNPVDEPGASVMSLVEVISMPLNGHVKHNGAVDTYREQEDMQHSELFSQSNQQERRISDEEFLASVGWEQKNGDN